MTESRAKILVIGVAAVTGALLGKFGERWGLSVGVRTILSVIIVIAVARILMTHHQQ